MADMSQRDQEAFEHFLKAYKSQWDLNEYYRTQHDEDMEYYLSYRDASQYPTEFNIFFNKLMPRIQTVLSRFMDQLYQAGTGNLVSVRPRTKDDVNRAKRVEGLLNAQLEMLNECDNVGGSYLFNMQWMTNALIYGKGIAKMVWKKEERIMPQRYSVAMPQFDQMGRFVGLENIDMVQEMPQIVYDGPYAEVLHNKLFVPHPHYRNIQDMPNVFCVYQRSLDYIKKMADKGVWKNVTDIGWTNNRLNNASALEGDTGEKFAKSLDIEGALTYADLDSEKRTPYVDVIEGYGRYIFPEDEVPYEVGSGIKIKGKESEAIVHIANYKTLLSIQKNKYEFRPFFDISAYHHPELYWDMGLIRLGKGIQEQINNLGNARYQNAMQLVHQMIKVRQDADIPMEALIPKPAGIIPVEDMDDVQPFIQQDVSQSGAFQEQEQFFESCLSDMTGMYPYNLGQTPPRQEHVGTIYSLQSMGEARSKLMLMTMDYQGFKPMLRYMMMLNAWNLPAKFEYRIGDPRDQEFTELFPDDIHPGYDFTARYTSMEPALGRQFRAQQLQTYAQVWAESPYLQHDQFMRTILELMDFHDVDRYVKTPQQMNQEQQQAMQQQAMAMAAEGEMEAQKQQREMQRDVVKGLLK